MNNASKGRCVTITPSDNSRETRLFVSQAQSENHYRAIFETLQDMEARSVVLPAGETVLSDVRWPLICARFADFAEFISNSLLSFRLRVVVLHPFL